MKNIITLLLGLLLISCDKNKNPTPPVLPPIVPVDTIAPPPPPVEDTIAPPPVVEVPDPPKEPEDNNYTLALNYYKIVEGKVSD